MKITIIKLLIFTFLLIQFINCKTVEPIGVTTDPYSKIGNYKLISAEHGDTFFVFPDSSQFLLGIVVDSNEVKIFDGMSNNHRGCYSVRSIPYSDHKIDTLPYEPSGNWYRSGYISFNNDSISCILDDTAGPIIYDFLKCFENIPPASWPDSICDM